MDNRSRRERRLRELLNRELIDIDTLRPLVWLGVPPDIRPQVWQLLLGYLPTDRSRTELSLERKRSQYKAYVEEIYEQRHLHETEKLVRDLKQIEDDLPRTQPKLAVFKDKAVQGALKRILYIWSVRHPASGYVQGMNDLCSILMLVFLQPFCEFDMLTNAGAIGPMLEEVEADCFWCLTVILDNVQDFFFPSSPGIQRSLMRIQEIIGRVDEGLSRHFKAQEVTMLQFAFRWFNCLLVRELPLRLVFCLWDAFMSEQDGFSAYAVYVAAALCLRWSSTLKTMPFQDIMLFLQSLPTEDWQERELQEVLAHAYQYYRWFHSSPQHLKSAEGDSPY
mmetsp:Transcript_31056/g.54006  ORF Transcript_31056/g.54006 Transcript_31056/m.54006 type:complete len:335 (-) Transcript_31056:4651-5655(-)